MIFSIYKLSFPDKSFYIGLTKNTLLQRISEHISKSKNNKYKNIPLYLKIKEFGVSKIEATILETYSNLSEAEKAEKNNIILDSSFCLNILSGGMGTDNKNIKLRERVSKGLKGHEVKEKTKEKLRMSATIQFSNKENREIARKNALKQFQDPIKKQNYLNAISKIDRKKSAIKRIETEKKKREIIFKKIKKYYIKGIKMTELSKKSGVSYCFIRKWKLQWLPIN